MCNRYVSPDQAAIERAWHIGRHNQKQWALNGIGPRGQGPFLRAGVDGIDLVVGQWALIPDWAKTAKLNYATNNCRSEEAAGKATFRDAWRKSQRCIIPATSFDEPCWETGKNVWFRFRRADGLPWGLAGLWNTWTDRTSGEVFESYTMLTINADDHPIMNRMHKPDPTLPPDQQDKRSVIAIEVDDVDRWLRAGWDEAGSLLKAPDVELISLE